MWHFKRLLAMAWVLVLTGAAAPAQERIVNGSFSEGGSGVPAGWRDGGAEGGLVKAGADNSVYVSAPASAHVEGSPGGKGSIQQHIADLKPAWYRVRGKIRSQNVKNAGIAFSVIGANGQTTWNEAGFIVGTQDWSSFDVMTRMPDGTQSATLLAYGEFDAKGAFWVDDLSMEEVAAPEGRFSIFDFTGGSTMRSSYHGWDKAFSGSAEGMITNVAGDGGSTLNRHFSVQGMGDYVPVLHAKVLPQNTATHLDLLLQGDGQPRLYRFELPAPADNFVSVLAKDFTPVSRAIEGAGQYAYVKDAQLKTSSAYNQRAALVIQGVELVAPGQPVARQGVGQATAAAQGSGDAAAAGYTGELPVIRNISVESPQYVGITIDSRYILTTAPASYESSEEDRLEDVEGLPQFKRVLRGDTLVGYLDSSSKMLFSSDRIHGIPLEPATAAATASYALSSREDRNFVQPLRPAEVSMKLIPVDAAMPGQQAALRYQIFLKFPKPLLRERSYEIAFGFGPKPVKFKYSPLRMRSQAIHVTQLGYRPDDPVKTGRFSLWLGDAGGLPFTPSGFHVIEEPSGKSVLQGSVKQVRQSHDADSLTPGRSMTGADVWLMDFSELKTPGNYRLFVPDVGVSEPFTIAATTWQDAFQSVMRGFYTQRAGIDKDSPYVEFSRRRMYHPLDGNTVQVSSTSLLETSLAPGGQGSDWRSIGAGRIAGARITEAFAGYFENGRSTLRQVNHLDATRMHLELFLMFPRVYSKVPLSIPEAGRREADLLDEALWNVDLFRSLQLADGGVCGALIDPAAKDMYPIPAISGSQLLALAPDVYSTYSYAATAARAALALQVSNVAAAGKLQQSAIKAWDWAEAQRVTPASETVAAAVRDRRNLAAVELLRLTSDKRYHQAFVATTCLKELPATAFRSGKGGFDQREAVFIYARLGDSVADAQIRTAALAALKNDADAAVALSAGNAWGLVTAEPGRGLLFGDGIVPLINGHYALKDPAYLGAAIQQASFMLGGNPSNRCFVTAIGAQATRGAGHTYTRAIGKEPPKGLVLPGPFDPLASAMMDWPVVRQNPTGFSPGPELWPAAECVLDFAAAPEQSDYSITGTMGPASYLLGYLAAR